MREAMRRRRTVFGEVADVYDEVRPGYPDDLVRAVFAYAGGTVDSAVEVGAGTGKGTEAFVRHGVRVRCLEPDPKMAAVLRQRFADSEPDSEPATAAVSVEVTRFEDWSPPPGGVPLLFCAQAWHWVEPLRRCVLAHAALSPGSPIALFGHQYRFADEEMLRAINGAYAVHAPELVDPDNDLSFPATPPEQHWLADDLTASGLFSDVTVQRFDRTVAYPTERYLDLVRTYSPFRMVPPSRQPVVLAGLAAVIDGLGGVVEVRLNTALALGRRVG
jgi:hypothetical protein